MSALRKAVQRIFQTDDERLQAVARVLKIDGKKKKRPTFLCIAVSIEHPISVRICFVKGEKDDVFKKKDQYHLRDVREVDGINPKKALSEFCITIGDRRLVITTSSAEEKDEFIRELFKLSEKYVPVQMPDFCNVSLPIDDREPTIVAIEVEDDGTSPTQHDYQPITSKEEADFRKLLARAELSIGQADMFAEVLTGQLQSLDGANIQSMLGSERAVNDLIGLLDGVLNKVTVLEKEVDDCDSILANVRNSVELIEEKDSLSVVERKNKERLHEELKEFVKSLDAVTDAHLRTLEEANFSDPASINRCAEAARSVSQFWHGRLSKALLQMKAYQDRNKQLVVVDMFVDRLMSHLTALFNNLNDLAATDNWHNLSIPKQSQRFHALFPLSDLISWLKANRVNPYNAAIVRYVEATKLMYKRIFDNFFDNLNAEVLKVKTTGKSPNSSFTSSRTNTTGSSMLLDVSTELDQLSTLIETVLGELGPVVEKEQKFCTRFFHINSELLAQAETTSTGSGDSASIGGKNAEKLMNEQVRNVMVPLFESLNGHLKRFSDVICKQNPSNVLLLFVIISKKVLSPQDAGSYFNVTFGSLVVNIKRQFDQYMENEGQSLADMKITKRARIGILPNIQKFADFIRNAEKTFENAERRTDLEKWYSHLYLSVLEGIRRAAVSPNSKSPAAVVEFENYHELYLTVSELKISCLDQLRKKTKRDLDEKIAVYVEEYMGRPLEKIHLFFENVQSAIRNGSKPEEISYQPQFSRIELKKVLSMYPGKEVRKNLEQLYKKVEKHLVGSSSLREVVWGEMQKKVMSQIGEYEGLIARCYPGASVHLEVSVNDIANYCSEIVRLA